MHMANAAVGAALPSRFAQAAPMLGVTAVASGGCGGADGGPAPGLRAPPFEEGAPGHFHCMLLGSNARLVTESQLLVVQSCELQAWRATRGVDCMPRCMERVGACMHDLREVLEAAAAAAAGGAPAAAGQPSSPWPRRIAQLQERQGGQDQGAAAGGALMSPQLSPFAAVAGAAPSAAFDLSQAGADAGAEAVAEQLAAAVQQLESQHAADDDQQEDGQAADDGADAAEGSDQQGAAEGEEAEEGEEGEEGGETLADLQHMPTSASTLTCGWHSRRTTAGGYTAGIYSRRTTAAGRRASQLLSPREDGAAAAGGGKAAAVEEVERGASPVGDGDELTPPTSGRPPSPPVQEKDASVMWYNTLAVHSQRSSARGSVDGGAGAAAAAAAYGEQAAAESGGGAEDARGGAGGGVQQWLEQQRGPAMDKEGGAEEGGQDGQRAERPSPKLAFKELMERGAAGGLVEGRGWLVGWLVGWL
jgi:hypothetical protein